jgi:hypothetical protein
MRFGLFRHRTAEAALQAEAIERVKAWVGAVASLPAGASLAVNEIVCTDPSCPDTETIVLVMRPGRKTQALKVGKALPEVTEADVREALAEGDLA